MMRLAVGLTLCMVPVESSLNVHALFADHAVLQTTDDGGAGARISGTGEAGEEIKLVVASKRYISSANPTVTTKVDSSGKWLMELNMTSGGPYTLTLSGSESKETLSATDVLFGDVYICSGQSNMVFPIGAGNPYRTSMGAQSIENASAEIAAANHPDMRLWFVPSPAANQLAVPIDSPLAQRKYVKENNGKIYLGQETPQTNLTGGCPVETMCYGSKSDPQNWSVTSGYIFPLVCCTKN